MGRKCQAQYSEHQWLHQDLHCILMSVSNRQSCCTPAESHFLAQVSPKMIDTSRTQEPAPPSDPPIFRVKARAHLQLGDPSPGIEDVIGTDGGVDAPLHAVLKPPAVVRHIEEDTELAVVDVLCQGHAGERRPHKDGDAACHYRLAQAPRRRRVPRHRQAECRVAHPFHYAA